MIKNNVRRERQRKGIASGTLANELGIYRTHLSKIEHYLILPRPALMEAICLYFGKSLGEMFYIEIDEEEGKR